MDPFIQDLYRVAIEAHRTVQATVDILEEPTVSEKNLVDKIRECTSEEEREICTSTLVKVRSDRLQRLESARDNLTKTTLNIQAFESLVRNGVGVA